METVIEKAVELGAREIVPVEMKHCVVRLDEKKKKSRVRRYQTIAENAARQSKTQRSTVDVISYREALERAKTSDICLVPYECEDGMASTEKALAKIAPGKSCQHFRRTGGRFCGGGNPGGKGSGDGRDFPGKKDFAHGHGCHRSHDDGHAGLREAEMTPEARMSWM